MPTPKINPQAREIGQRLRQTREGLGLKAWLVAQRLEMSTEGYRMYEVGRARIATTDLARFAEALEVSQRRLAESLGLLGDETVDAPASLTDEEEADLARLEPQFKNLAFATGRRYEKGTPEEKRQMLAILKALAGEEYREPIEDDA